MWFALFWLQPLRDFWRRELGDKYFRTFQRDHSLHLDSGSDAAAATCGDSAARDSRLAGGGASSARKSAICLLKISGFSPLGWGSRGVALGSDLAARGMAAADRGRARRFEQRADDHAAVSQGPALRSSVLGPRQTEELKTMRGRVRLCPYYFVEPEKVMLRGALATICPADKKLLHGMRDAILVPSRFAALALSTEGRESVLPRRSSEMPNFQPQAREESRKRSSRSNNPWTRSARSAAGIAPSRIVALSLRLSPLRIGSPRPPAPISAASVAVPMLITALVLMPARMVREASGR